jgi:hypothetical protein
MWLAEAAGDRPSGEDGEDRLRKGQGRSVASIAAEADGAIAMMLRRPGGRAVARASRAELVRRRELEARRFRRFDSLDEKPAAGDR